MAFKMNGWSAFTYETNPDGTPRKGGKTWGMSRESGPLTPVNGIPVIPSKDQEDQEYTPQTVIPKKEITPQAVIDKKSNERNRIEKKIVKELKQRRKGIKQAT